jgi:hypothetical protein
MILYSHSIITTRIAWSAFWCLHGILVLVRRQKFATPYTTYFNAPEASPMQKYNHFRHRESNPGHIGTNVR